MSERPRRTPYILFASPIFLITSFKNRASTFGIQRERHSPANQNSHSVLCRFSNVSNTTDSKLEKSSSTSHRSTVETINSLVLCLVLIISHTPDSRQQKPCLRTPRATVEAVVSDQLFKHTQRSSSPHYGTTPASQAERRKAQQYPLLLRLQQPTKRLLDPRMEPQPDLQSLIRQMPHATALAHQGGE